MDTVRAGPPAGGGHYSASPVAFDYASMMSNDAAGNHASADHGVLLIETIQRLEDELRPQGRAVQVTFDSDLERDLGLDSLARVELLLRIERAFDVQLGEDLFASAQTPRDLIAALARAVPGTRCFPAAPVDVAGGERGRAAPGVTATLLEVLAWHAGHHPDRTHAIFHRREGGEEMLTYRQLQEAGQGVAYGLSNRDFRQGQTVAVMLPTGAAFLHSFLGILMAGGVPVPIYPPLRRAGLADHLRRQAAILNNARAAILITVAKAKAFAGLLQAQVPTLRYVVTAEELGQVSPYPQRMPLKGEDLALLQYTSGSTGDPKGVMLSHANLLANIRAMGRRIEADSEDIFVSWLPLYHDMGLIGAWLGCLYHAIPLVLLSPQTFLSHPAEWLRAMHRYRGTLSGGPNFAYALCVQKVRDEEIEGLDLSRWRFAFNGAEPISVATMERFCRRFADYGFQARAMAPVYGLAECAVGLAFPPSRREPRVDYVAREPLVRDGVAQPAAPGQADAMAVVSCGSALPGHEIRVVDGRDHEVGERRQGRLQFKGPSATQGYFRNEQATAQLLHGQWRDSGDLAYLADGEVFVTGRAKEIIIRAGRNIHPYELEEAVGAVPGVRKGCVAAFGVADPGAGTEALVIVAETRETDESSREQLRQRINAVVIGLIGNPPDDVLLTPPHTLLKTSSGKIRRAENRALYARGKLLRRESPWRRWGRLLLPVTRMRLRHGIRGLVGGAYGAYAWTLFLPLALITWAAVMVLPGRRRRMAVIRFMGRLVSSLTFVRLRVEGVERLARGPCIIVANHASYLDGLVLSVAVPGSPGYVVKGELARNALIRRFLERIGGEFVERFDARRGVEDTKRLQALARKGVSLVFFPEGTFVRTAGVRPFRMGAFLVAVEAGVPVVPAALRGTRAVLPSGTWLPRRGTVTVTVGAPISPQGGDWAAAVQLRDAARTQLLALSGEADLG